MFIQKFTSLFIVLCLGYTSSRKLPTWIEQCRLKDPKIQDCFLRNVEIIRPKILNGIPEMEMPSLNPLKVSRADIITKGFNASFENIEIYHAENFVLKNLNVDFEKNHLEIELSFPLLRIKSIYRIQGRILVVDINGQGPADGNYTNVYGKLVLDGGRVIRKGKEYLAIDKKHLDLGVGKVHFKFDNIFGNNEQLNTQTNKIINENADNLVEDMKPVITQVVTDILFGILNRIMTRYSIDDLFDLS